MSGPMRGVSLLLLIALLVVSLVIIRRARRVGSKPVQQSSQDSSPDVEPLAFHSSADCIRCHEAIGKEWLESPHSRPWGTHPFMPKDPGRTECSSCHIPQPIYLTGLVNPVVVRGDRHDEGVGCITCHVRGDSCLGLGKTREAPCNPTQERSIGTSEACRPCHAFHGTLDEWKRSKFYKLGQGCQHCHMPRVRRPLVKGGPVRDGHSHRMLGGRDPKLLAQSLSVSARIEQGKLVVTLVNDKVGHAVPGEISNRRIHLVMTSSDESGAELAEVFRTFKAPPRPKRQVVKTTQIQPGQTVRVIQPLPKGWAQVVVALEYKLLMLGPSHTFYRKVLRR